MGRESLNGLGAGWAGTRTQVAWLPAQLTTLLPTQAELAKDKRPIEQSHKQQWLMDGQGKKQSNSNLTTSWSLNFQAGLQCVVTYTMLTSNLALLLNQDLFLWSLPKEKVCSRWRKPLGSRPGPRESVRVVSRTDIAKSWAPVGPGCLGENSLQFCTVLSSRLSLVGTTEFS